MLEFYKGVLKDLYQLLDFELNSKNPKYDAVATLIQEILELKRLIDFK